MSSWRKVWRMPDENMASMLTHQQRVRVLYKTILRLHRGLPMELRALGDVYTKDEFKRHRKCNDEEVTTAFMAEWTKYALRLSEQLGLRGKSKGLGDAVSEDELESLRDEQVIQLYELMLAARGEPPDAGVSKGTAPEKSN